MEASELTEQEAQERSEAQENDRDFYCPGCGRRGDYHQQCKGRGEAPHQPIEMVSTDELYDGSDPTPAPNTDKVG